MQGKTRRLQRFSGSWCALAGLLISVSSASCAGCTRPEGDPAKSETRLALARDYLLKEQYEAAESEVNKAIAYLPTNDEAYNVRGLIFVRRATGIQRITELDACLTGVDAEAQHQDLDAFLTKAAGDFDKATQLAPDYGDAWNNRGLVANLMGDYELATDVFTKALANPARLQDPGVTRSHLAWSYFLRGDQVSAAKELRQALQFQPHMCLATYRLGRVYFAREEWEKAAEQFQDVTELPDCRQSGPFFQEAALYLMKARLQQGLTAEAQAARDACLLTLPESCNAVQCRGQQL